MSLDRNFFSTTRPGGQTRWYVTARDGTVGDRVAIVRRGHPHHGESGTIAAAATGGPRSVGLDWLVKLDDCPELVEGCFVSEDEIRPERRSRR